MGLTPCVLDVRGAELRDPDIEIRLSRESLGWGDDLVQRTSHPCVYLPVLRREGVSAGNGWRLSNEPSH